MRDFRIALVQQISPVGKTEANLAQTVAWARKAADAGARLVLFPELSLTGHAGHEAATRDAESLPDGPCCQRLMEAARDLNLFIAAGIAEREGPRTYNTQFVVGPDGYVGRQRKLHPSQDEYFLFRGGTTLPVFDLPFARVGIAICYDNVMPETSRCLAIDGAEVILAPHAARIGPWPRDVKRRREAVAARRRSWERMHVTRALDNGVYVALCNAVGRSAVGLKGCEANHAGVCMVIDPVGRMVAASRARDMTREEMVVADLPARPVAAARRQVCFPLNTRKPEVYGAITRPTA